MNAKASAVSEKLEFKHSERQIWVREGELGDIFSILFCSIQSFPFDKASLPVDDLLSVLRRVLSHFLDCSRECLVLNGADHSEVILDALIRCPHQPHSVSGKVALTRSSLQHRNNFQRIAFIVRVEFGVRCG